jgi:putative ABC transport system substrate-binding protein
MIRKTFILLLALLLAAVVAQAQQAGKGHRIGVLLYAGAPPGLLEAFWEGLRELGYVEGQNLTIALRNAEGKNERLSALAAELVQLKVDVILAVNTPSAQAAKQATATVPIVITRIGDAMGAGLVPSLARPGGNVTGLSFDTHDLGLKRMQVLKEILPGISRVGMLFNADNPGAKLNLAEIEEVSAQLGLAFLPLPVRGPSDFPGALQAATRERAEALVVFDDTAITQHRTQLLRLAAQHALPVASIYKDFAEAGGLIAYGPSLPALYRRAAYYVDRILQGAKPSELPVERPMKFELVINLKTAQGLGLTIPPSLLFQADEVIK